MADKKSDRQDAESFLPPMPTEPDPALAAPPEGSMAGDSRPMTEPTRTFDEVQEKGYLGYVTEESEKQTAEASLKAAGERATRR